MATIIEAIAAITNKIEGYHWLNLICAAFLACVWLTVAVQLFRRRGWQ